MSNGRPITRNTEHLAWEVRTRPLGLQAGLAAEVSGVAVDARRIYATHFLYAPNQPVAPLGAKLVVLDADTLSTLREIQLTGLPRAVAVGPNRNRIYVAGTGQTSNQLQLFDSNTFASVATGQFNGQPRRVVHSISRSRVYVTEPSAGLLHILNDTTGAAATSPVNVGEHATGLAIDGDRIFVTLARPSPVPQQNALLVINADTNAILQNVPIPPLQSTPQDVVVLPAVKRVFVTNSGFGGGTTAPRLTVLSRETFAPIAEIPLPGNPTHLAADVVRNRVYVATSAGLVVVDGAQNRIVTVLGTEGGALGAGFSQATGQLVWGDRAGGTIRSAVQSGESGFDLQLLRPDDLLSLDFTFHNLKLVTDGGPPRLVREVANQPAFVAVHFAPQSIAEQTSTPQANVQAPVRALLSGRSRLVFRVPDNLAALPYAAAELLDWAKLQPSLHPAALPRNAQIPNPPPGNTQPLLTHTAIELPYRLLLSPDNTTTWEHAAQPVTRKQRSELWHTRLRQRDNPRADPDVRAVWTPDLVIAPPHNFDFPLNGNHRKQIARLSSDWTLANGSPSFRPLPVEADELMLSALGGFLRVRGAWGAPAQLGLNLAAWRQTTTLGRDHKVVAVTRGVLFPWGHRGVKVETSEREITTTPAGPIAALRKRVIILVSEPEKSFTGAPFEHAGRELPFASSVRLLTSATTELDTANLETVAGPAGDPAFWIRTVEGPFDFDIAAQDAAGNRVTWQSQLIWVPEPLLFQQAELAKIVNAYTSDNRRKIVIAGQPVALAKATSSGAAALAGTPNDTSLTVERLDFGIQFRMLPTGMPSALPRLERAAARIPAVEQMLGAAQAVDVELYDEYLKHGFDGAKNAAAVFAKLAVSRLPKLELPVEKAGGLAAAAFEIQGISQRLGPVMGNLKELATGNFSAKSLSALAGSKLLGTISLLELIETATGVDFDKQLPATGTEIERDANGVPKAFTNRLKWEPKVKSVGPFVANLGGDTASMTIDTFFRQEVSGGEPDYSITGVLRNFHIEFLSVMDVNFRRLEFKSVAGKKPDIEPVLDQEQPITFKGPLAFLDKLREKIPFDGFSDPPALDISPRGIDVSYSLPLPPLSFGAFNLQNVTLGAGLFLPFVDEAARLRFNFAERHNPFQVAVLAIAGGGFLALDIALNRIVAIEAALEFGGSVAVNLGVASGGVYIMAGVYFSLKSGLDNAKPETELTGYLRAGGYLKVLGLVSVSTEFYMELRYEFEANQLRGQAMLRVKISVAFFSKTVKLKMERKFAGPPRSQAALEARSAELVAALDDDPNFGDGMTEADWQAYVSYFA